jgi:hypothetical protein
MTMGANASAGAALGASPGIDVTPASTASGSAIRNRRQILPGAFARTSGPHRIVAGRPMPVARPRRRLSEFIPAHDANLSRGRAAAAGAFA